MNKKLVIITGASSGIGAETAKLFSEKGHPLLLLARRLEEMQALGLPNTMCISADVTDRKAVREAIMEAEAVYGPADLLVNNAGVMLLGEVYKQDVEEWDRMIDVNIKGILSTTHAVLPDMKMRKTGTIINISSVAGRKTFDNHAVYCGTKFAVHAISEALRKEVSADNVRVVVIAPGAVETELLSHTTDNAIKAGYEEWKKSIHRALEPDSVAHAIWYAYSVPQEVCIREIVIAKTQQDN